MQQPWHRRKPRRCPFNRQFYRNMVAVRIDLFFASKRPRYHQKRRDSRNWPPKGEFVFYDPANFDSGIWIFRKLLCSKTTSFLTFAKCFCAKFELNPREKNGQLLGLIKLFLFIFENVKRVYSKFALRLSNCMWNNLQLASFANNAKLIDKVYICLCLSCSLNLAAELLASFSSFF